jgi:nucleoside-diphosphate-sugar epimerase
VHSKALVCGASGFLGTALCRRLIDLGVEVHGQSRTARSTPADLRWWQADLTDPADSARLLASVRPDVIFNLAGVSDARPNADLVVPLFRSNALSCVNLLSAALSCGCQRFVQTASLQEPDLGDDAVPASPYALSKWVERVYVDFFHRHCGLHTVLLRFGIVYGPGEESRQRVVPYVITSLIRGEAPRLSSGHQPADWIYVEDAVDAFVAAAESERGSGQSFNVGSGTQVSVRTVATEIAKQIGNGVQPLFGALPDRPIAPTRDAEPSRVFRELGWRPRTSLDAGLRATIAWYRSQLG